MNGPTIVISQAQTMHRSLGGVKLACKDPTFSQSQNTLLDLNYIFYNLPLQIHKIEDALCYKIVPLNCEYDMQ